MATDRFLPLDPRIVAFRILEPRGEHQPAAVR
jgi:hypothetical protein